MGEDKPKPEANIRIYTEKETVIGFYDGMYYYSEDGRMLPTVHGWEYVSDFKKA